jgi:xylan 1,4-beta-xylosidase
MKYMINSTQLWKKYMILQLLLIVSLCSCGKKTTEEVKQEPVPSPTYPLNQADPSIFYHEGTYYLYGTNDNDAENGFQVYTSADLKKWIFKGTAMRKGDAFGDTGFWAPQVFASGGKFYMAYTANEKIAIAESTSPLGPFKQNSKTALASAYGQIDPYVFVDDDGKKYLFHVRIGNGNRIWVAELKADFSEVIPSTATECITVSAGTWEQVSSPKVAEGPTVIKMNGTYYMFYSANDFRNVNYSVGYATSKSPFGPWQKYAANPILSSIQTEVPGSGHGDVLKDKDGKLLYVFHTHNEPGIVTPRKTALISFKSIPDAVGNGAFELDKSGFAYLNFSYK